MNKVIVTNEILAAVLASKMTDEERQGFASSPKDFATAKMNYDFGDVALHAVTNEANEVNLTLPYYSDLDTPSAQALRQEHLDDVAGGEVAVIVGILIGVGATVVAGGVAAGALGISYAISRKNHQLDGNEDLSFNEFVAGEHRGK